MTVGERLISYYAFVKGLPCIITGVPGVDVAHVNATIRAVGGPRTAIGTSHRGRRGYMCVPLAPHMHRQDSDYPFSWHQIGQAAFLERHGMTEADLAWLVAVQLAEFLRDE